MPMYARFPHLLAPGCSSKSFSRLCLLVPSRHSHALRRKNTINPLFFSLISSKIFFLVKKIRNKNHLPGWPRLLLLQNLACLLILTSFNLTKFKFVFRFKRSELKTICLGGLACC